MEAGVAFVHAVPADVPQKPPEAAPRVVDAPPTAADDLAELLAAAKEGAAAPPPDPTAKVSQDDIDSLFGD